MAAFTHVTVGTNDLNKARAFYDSVLAPLGLTDPWYVVRISATDGSWTAKLVFVAANAWNAAQASWLEATLGEPTTYTFVVRHEGNNANTAPGVDPSNAIIAQHPLTHQEVVEVARAVEGKFSDLLRAFIPRAFAALPARTPLG